MLQLSHSRRQGRYAVASPFPAGWNVIVTMGSDDGAINRQLDKQSLMQLLHRLPSELRRWECCCRPRGCHPTYRDGGASRMTETS